jgi:hypothetical protein
MSVITIGLQAGRAGGGMLLQWRDSCAGRLRGLAGAISATTAPSDPVTPVTGRRSMYIF